MDAKFDVRPTERLRLEETIESYGFWKVARISVCHGCDRYKPTNRQRICRRCTTAAMADMAQDLMTEEATHTQEESTDEP